MNFYFKMEQKIEEDDQFLCIKCKSILRCSSDSLYCNKNGCNYFYISSPLSDSTISDESLESLNLSPIDNNIIKNNEIKNKENEMFSELLLILSEISIMGDDYSI